MLFISYLNILKYFAFLEYSKVFCFISCIIPPQTTFVLYWWLSPSQIMLGHDSLKTKKCGHHDEY
jgi:hypothetical protein